MCVWGGGGGGNWKKDAEELAKARSGEGRGRTGRRGVGVEMAMRGGGGRDWEGRMGTGRWGGGAMVRGVNGEGERGGGNIEGEKLHEEGGFHRWIRWNAWVDIGYRVEQWQQTDRMPGTTGAMAFTDAASTWNAWVE